MDRIVNSLHPWMYRDGTACPFRDILAFPHIGCFLFSCDCSATEATEVVLMPLHLVSVNHMQNSQESK